MKIGHIRALLFLTILVMTVLPLAAAFYLLDGALETSLDLGFNASVVQVLNDSSQNLKALKRLEPQERDRYREQFETVERLKRVYSNPEPVKSNILGSLRIYFGLGLIAAVLLSVLLAAMLSRRITRSYEKTFEDLMHHKEKVRYLEEIGSWQELARMLAHEIKNPLTPIEVLVTSLSKAYLSKNERDFREHLRATEVMIAEELSHLKSTVSKFSEFARLPAVQLGLADLPEVLHPIVRSLAASFESADIHLITPPGASAMPVRIDVTLFRQVLTNIIRNGVEASAGRRVAFSILLGSTGSVLSIAIGNDGPPVAVELAPRIFDPYVSGKAGKDNMGLGLAIVKKIVIEHGGEIGYQEEGGRPVFTICLPRAGEPT